METSADVPQGSASEDPLWYIDVDGDGYGRDSIRVQAAEPPEGYVAVAGDCDDTRADVHPGATEVCDLVDDDCDHAVDGDDTDLGGLVCTWRDDDGDGWGQDGVGTLSAEVGPAQATQPGDCDDTDPAVYPGATEIDGDHVDSDCDGPDHVSGEQLDVRGVAAAAIEGEYGFGWRLDPLGDVDGDGVRDLQVVQMGGMTTWSGESGARYSSTPGGTAVLSGASLLGSPTPVVLAVTRSDARDAGDVDGDGRDDVWVTRTDDALRGPMLLSGADYAQPGPVPLATTQVDVGAWSTAPDADGDLHVDIAVIESSDPSVLRLRWFGSGTRGVRAESDARTTVTWPRGEDVEYGPGTEDVGDLDGDGLDDLVLVEWDVDPRGGSAWLLSDLPTGDVQLADFDPLLPPGAVLGNPTRVGDTDGDGQDDLALESGLWTGNPRGWRVGHATATGCCTGGAGDVDGDGLADVFTDLRRFPTTRNDHGTIAYGPLEGYVARTGTTLSLGVPEEHDSDRSVGIDALMGVPIGDIDGDGRGDLAFSITGYHANDWSLGDDEWYGPGTVWIVRGSDL